MSIEVEYKLEGGSDYQDHVFTIIKDNIRFRACFSGCSITHSKWFQLAEAVEKNNQYFLIVEEGNGSGSIFTSDGYTTFQCSRYGNCSSEISIKVPNNKCVNAIFNAVSKTLPGLILI